MLTLKELKKYESGELNILDDFEYYSVFLEAVEQISHNKTSLAIYDEQNNTHEEIIVFYLDSSYYLRFTEIYDQTTGDTLHTEVELLTPCE